MRMSRSVYVCSPANLDVRKRTGNQQSVEDTGHEVSTREKSDKMLQITNRQTIEQKLFQAVSNSYLINPSLERFACD
jgi:hypothetical protein